MMCKIQRGVRVELTALLGVLMVFTHPVLSKASNFAQTSFISVGENSSGAADSHMTGADGVTKGECVYVSEGGKSIKVKYTETPDGTVTAESDNPEVQDAQAELTKCKETVAHIGEEVEKDIRKHQEVIEKQNEKLRRLQERFNRQQDEFRKKMQELEKKMEERLANVMENFKREQDRLLQQRTLPFDGFRDPSIN